MNIPETKQVLAMLYALYPSAPKLTGSDVEAMARAWHDLMKDYSQADVWLACKEAAESSINYIPSAVAVMKHCHKHPDPELFMSNPLEYRDDTVKLACMRQEWRNEKKLALWCARNREYDTQMALIDAMDGGESPKFIKEKEEEYQKAQKEVAELETFYKQMNALDEKITRIYDDAEQTALFEYDNTERKKNGLKPLSELTYTVKEDEIPF